MQYGTGSDHFPVFKQNMLDCPFPLNPRSQPNSITVPTVYGGPVDGVMSPRGKGWTSGQLIAAENSYHTVIFYIFIMLL